MTEPTDATIQKGQTRKWANGIYFTVRRVARDGSWADIACVVPATGKEWTKRQPIPSPVWDSEPLVGWSP